MEEETNYSKGYTTNWIRELFKKRKVNPTNPITDAFVDQTNASIEGI